MKSVCVLILKNKLKSLEEEVLEINTYLWRWGIEK